MEQTEAYNYLLGHENCFLTGRAGTGKSFLIKKLLDELGHSPALMVTATTGIAARNITGQTVHAAFGIGLGRKYDPETRKLEDFERFWQKCEYSPFFNWTGLSSVEHLVIDEISMMTGTFLQDIQRILKRVKKNNQPFGGVKMIMVGDMLQLPPITRGSQVFDWAFKCDAWRSGGIKVLNLQKSYRHDDPVWLAALNDVREARISRETNELLRSRSADDVPAAYEGTVLMTHNEQAARYNRSKLDELPGAEREFRAQLAGKEHKVKQLLESITTPEALCLRKGARVLMTVNDREGVFYNGTRAVVLDWTPDTVRVELETGEQLEVERFTFSDENRNVQGTKPTATAKQFPMKLAWAVTIHSSQGLTLTEVFVQAEHVFTAHQLYVALSRCKTSAGLTIQGFEPSKCYVDYDARAFYEQLPKP